MEPDYNCIYRDIIAKKYPQKSIECEKILGKKKLNAIDILEVNQRIFGSKNKSQKQSHRSYKKSDILKILDYQKKHKFNNIELARHFKLSRNTITKWKKIFLVDY